MGKKPAAAAAAPAAGAGAAPSARRPPVAGQRSSTSSRGGRRSQTLAAVGVPLAGVVVALLAALFTQLRSTWEVDAIVKPFRGPRMTGLPQFGAPHRGRMLWGSYRPGLLFGMRTRVPAGLMTGLLWYDPDSPATVWSDRIWHETHTAPEPTSYMWRRHDGVSYGRQSVLSRSYNLTIHMVKQRHGEEQEGDVEGGAVRGEGGRGGDWAVRVTVTRPGASPKVGRPRRCCTDSGHLQLACSETRASCVASCIKCPHPASPAKYSLFVWLTCFRDGAPCCASATCMVRAGRASAWRPAGAHHSAALPGRGGA